MSDDPLLNKGELGPYRIERKLGQGAMGGVYLGLHRVLEVHHAIKVIHPRLLGDATLIERFLREARNTAKLKHLNIVQVVGADQVDGIYYLAMEFVQGRPLDDVLRDTGLSIHDAVRYAHMIANALQYAHSRNIIHRDVKPANIMINDEDIAKLMDFGLVRDVGTPDAPESGQQLTMDGFIMGTPQYMPIEQWQGEGVDARSDIYALGATLYVLLTGKLPYPGKNAREIFRNVLSITPKDVREHNPDIDDDLALIVHTAIAPDKEERYQTAQELALALENWWDAHPYQGTSLFKAPVIDDTRAVVGGTRAPTTATRAVLTHSTLEGSSPTDMGSSRSSAPLIAIVALLLIVGGGVAAFFVFSGEPPTNLTPDPTPTVEFSIGLEPDLATETRPVPVTQSAFSIPGKGKATVNGKPYEFGTALTLTPGLNKLEVASLDGSAGRTLFVLFDDVKPEIEVPALAQWADNLIPIREQSFKLSGRVSDEGCGLRDLKLTLIVNAERRELVFNEFGEFERDIPVSEDDVTLELQAEDRAGNRSPALTFWVVPDREPLRLEFDEAWKPASRWVTGRAFDLTGRINKSRGVQLAVDGEAVVVASDGSFRAAITREPGAHTIKLTATDWLGRMIEFTKDVVVDLQGPALTILEPPEGGVQLETSLPASIAVRGQVDDPTQAKVTVNGDEVALRGGQFSTTITATEFGEIRITVEVTDPAGRKDTKEVALSIRQLKYRELGKNSRGYTEYERVKDGMVMVMVPGGKFTRGNKDFLADAPAVEIELSSFLIAKYEVTTAQFAKFLTASSVTAEESITRRWLVKNEEGLFTGLVPTGRTWEAAPGEESRPVVNVTWFGANAYCEWSEGALPSEAQWEYAARGGDGRAFPWGNELPNAAKANTALTGRDSPSEVTKQEAGESPFGVRNLCGNVEEWCLDWYEEGAYLSADQQRKDPARTSKPDAVDRRVVRGGSVLSPIVREPRPIAEDEPAHLQTYARARRLPETGAGDRGFRPVAPPPAD